MPNMTSITMSGSVKLTSTTGEFTTNILQSIVASINNQVQGRLANVVDQIKEVVRKALADAPEFKAVLPGGDSYGSFGLVDGAERIDGIVNMLVNSITVRLTPFRYSGNGVIGGKIEIVGLPVDCREVLASAEGTLISESGKQWSWLHALLVQGDEIVIANYRYLSDVISEQSKEKYSRTKQGFMVQTDSHGWKVESGISGSLESNLITRAVDRNGVAIQSILQTLLD